MKKFYTIKFLKEAEAEFKQLDQSLFLRVSKILIKLSENPEGYSEPLGQKMNLNLSRLRKVYGSMVIFLIN